MLGKLKVMGQAGKAVSYLFLALNQGARFTSSIARNVGNGIRNKGLFSVTLIAQDGIVLKELCNQTSSQISDILEQMENFGITCVTIEKSRVIKNDN
tara:strand:- start:544 stop:834 length:291 start_codon:yes stop_codon:yes gene_type:complete